MFDLSVISRVEHGEALYLFANALLGTTDLTTLNKARETLSGALGSAAVVSSSIIAGVFGLLDRAANGVRITAKPKVLQPRFDFRGDFGINYYRSAANTLACSSLSQYWCR